MQITFGMFSDGAEWSSKTASLGEITMGPLRFLAWLESHTGLDGVQTPAPERINEYMQKICRVDPAWCRASFETDSWSTAKQMLAWRDDLMGNGWDGKSGGSERLKALSALEADPGPLSPGIPDRMKRVLTELQDYHFDDVLLLQEPPDLLPCLWKQVIEQLRRSGMRVHAPVKTERCTPEKFLIEGSNEFVLGTECARFLSAGDNRRTAIICEGNSSVLDGALQRSGIGRLNFAEKSRWRESLQILPLWLDTLWKPFNPQRFLELLLLPLTPIPDILAEKLTKALQKEPGHGGEAWNEAWESVKRVFGKDGKTDSRNPEFKKVADVWTMLENNCFRAEKETPAESIAAHCDFLIKRLADLNIEQHRGLALVVEHTRTLKKIVAGRDRIRQMELARMLDSIISTGTTGNQEGQDRTDFAVFTNPGMIERDFDTVLWWNFVDTGATNNTNWTADEISVMPGYDRVAARKLENLSWHNALNQARKNIIFFVPLMMNGEEAFPHPFKDELGIPDEEIIKQEKLTDSEGKWNLAGRSLALEKQPLFEPAIRTGIEANAIRPTYRLSYSQMKTLISCPFQWFLQNYLDLKAPPAMNVPTGPQMLGTLAHKVIEEIYEGKETLTVEEAVRDAETKFDQLLPSMAAELMPDARSVERKRIRTTLVDAVKVLVEEINRRNLFVRGNEKKLQGTFDGLDFIGYSDIYLEDADGNKFVIDMKWSTSSHYKKLIDDNKALQLATYSWLLDSDDLDVRCAYFLFPRKQLVSAAGTDWTELWNNARKAWEQRFSEIHSGELARGIEEESDLRNSTSALPLTAECAFCDYAAICAITED